MTWYHLNFFDFLFSVFDREEAEEEYQEDGEVLISYVAHDIDFTNTSQEYPDSCQFCPLCIEMDEPMDFNRYCMLTGKRRTIGSSCGKCNLSKEDKEFLQNKNLHIKVWID